MAILKVARIGHPVIRTKARELKDAEIRSSAVQRLIDDMVATMHEYDGVGLAAPQVHYALRLAVIEIPARDERAEDAVPLTVLVNPRVTTLGSEALSAYEGCLSVPGLRGVVPRWARVRLEARDREGRPYVVEADNFFARVIQHEYDHLDGTVYIDRMKGMQSLSFLEEFDKHHAAAEEE
jgi:peptide deformylase